MYRILCATLQSPVICIYSFIQSATLIHSRRQKKSTHSTLKMLNICVCIVCVSFGLYDIIKFFFVRTSSFSTFFSAIYIYLIVCLYIYLFIEYSQKHIKWADVCFVTAFCALIKVRQFSIIIYLCFRFLLLLLLLFVYTGRCVCVLSDIAV